MPPDKLSSFIPKTLPDEPIRSRPTLGILTFLGVILLMLSLGLLGGVFFYRRLVSSQIDELTLSVKRLEADFEPSLLTEFIQTAGAVNMAKGLLSGHHSASKVFDFLEANTLPSVRFSGFSFAAESTTVSLEGQAGSYTDLALQSEVFEKNPIVKRAFFSNFGLNEKGGVTFSVVLEFDPSIISFQ